MPEPMHADSLPGRVTGAAAEPQWGVKGVLTAIETAFGSPPRTKPSCSVVDPKTGA